MVWTFARTWAVSATHFFWKRIKIWTINVDTREGIGGGIPSFSKVWGIPKIGPYLRKICGGTYSQPSLPFFFPLPSTLLCLPFPFLLSPPQSSPLKSSYESGENCKLPEKVHGKDLPAKAFLTCLELRKRVWWQWLWFFCADKNVHRNQKAVVLITLRFQNAHKILPP